jgi:hypothetical protein
VCDALNFCRHLPKFRNNVVLLYSDSGDGSSTSLQKFSKQLSTWGGGGYAVLHLTILLDVRK